jgi:hypothetical protein
LTREEKQEQLEEESLDLPVAKTALKQQHPEGNGEENIELHKRKQCNSHKEQLQQFMVLTLWDGSLT